MRRLSIKAISLAAMLLAGAEFASAQSADALLDLLTKKGVISQREANDVRAQLDAQTAAAVEAYSKTKASSFLDSLKFSGDLRLRAEYFDNEDQASDRDRTRFRYRLRLQIEAQLPEWAKIGLRLASGDGDPVSTNQTMTDTFKKKPITVDAAYVTIMPPGLNWVSVTGGKMDLPIWQPKFNSPMVYDFDVTPEGIAEQINLALGDKQQHRVFANFGQFPLKEISSNLNDPFLMDFQAGIEAKFGGSDVAKNPRLRIAASGGYLLTQGLTDQTGSSASYRIGDSPNLGNATGAGASTNNWLGDFNVLYARGEVGVLLSERPFLGTPALLTVSGEYDTNLKGVYGDLADDQTDGWTVQVAFGEAKKKGQWQVAYQFKHLEADAVWDALTDSDFGTGGTDRKGHIVKGAYNVQDWWQLGIAAIITEKISNRPNSGHYMVGAIGASDEELVRLQFDSVFKF